MNKNRPNPVLAIVLMAMLQVVIPERAHAAEAPRAAPRSPSLVSAVAPPRQAYIEKILEVLDRKVADPALKTRAADKLATLGDRQLRLMAALSERVAIVGEGPADGIALFLITALLILS